MSESTVEDLTKQIEELKKKLLKKNLPQQTATQKYHLTPKGIEARKRASERYYTKKRKEDKLKKIKTLEIEKATLEARIEQIKKKIVNLST